MHVHIIGICGTFMAGIASIAKQLGMQVTGSDKNIYPPMSDVLINQGISISQGYEALLVTQQPDLYIIGNAATRGLPIIEDILKHKRSYQSGPAWLYEYVLSKKKVIAISGTHGKTTTSSLMTHVLESCGENPGFLIGGVPINFECSARITSSKYFVIEADEYDTAFFDKRSKMVHYCPDIAVINNLEFDHADIFDSIKDIQKQFHGMVRVMPSNGLIICPDGIETIEQLLSMGVWSQIIRFNKPEKLHAELLVDDGSLFNIYEGKKLITRIEWNLIGQHNIQNALAVIAICLQLSLPIKQVTEAFKKFKQNQSYLSEYGFKDVIALEYIGDFIRHLEL